MRNEKVAKGRIIGLAGPCFILSLVQWHDDSEVFSFLVLFGCFPDCDRGTPLRGGLCESVSSPYFIAYNNDWGTTSSLHRYTALYIYRLLLPPTDLS